MVTTWSGYLYPDSGGLGVCRHCPRDGPAYARPRRLTVEAPEEVPIPEGRLTGEQFDEFLAGLPIGSRVHIEPA